MIINNSAFTKCTECSQVHDWPSYLPASLLDGEQQGQPDNPNNVTVPEPVLW